MTRGLAGAALVVFAAVAQDWPQWRGPARDGVVQGFVAPAAWPKTLQLAWKTPVGGGYSSPVVAGPTAYVHTRQGEEEVVLGLDLETGKIRWRGGYPAPFDKNKYAMAHPKGPHSTPVISGGLLCTLGITAVLSCFDAATGALQWRKDFSPRVDTSRLFTGTAMSPVVDGGRLIAHVGDDRRGELVALDLATGAERWRWQGDGPGYASPLVVELGGVRQVVTLSNKAVFGIAADSGKLLWRFPFPDEWNENIVTPILFEGTLIVSGVRKPAQALRVAGGTAQSVWQNADIALYMNTPVLDGGRLFGLSTKRKGQFFCLDARTGATLWSSVGRAAENAAVVSAGPFLLWLTSDAELMVTAKNAARFEPLARYKVADSPTWAHPVVVGRRILIKDAASLALWRVGS